MEVLFGSQPWSPRNAVAPKLRVPAASPALASQPVLQREGTAGPIAEAAFWRIIVLSRL